MTGPDRATEPGLGSPAPLAVCREGGGDGWAALLLLHDEPFLLNSCRALFSNHSAWGQAPSRNECVKYKARITLYITNFITENFINNINDFFNPFLFKFIIIKLIKYFYIILISFHFRWDENIGFGLWVISQGSFRRQLEKSRSP